MKPTLLELAWQALRLWNFACLRETTGSTQRRKGPPRAQTLRVNGRRGQTRGGVTLEILTFATTVRPSISLPRSQSVGLGFAFKSDPHHCTNFTPEEAAAFSKSSSRVAIGIPFRIELDWGRARDCAIPSSLRIIGSGLQYCRRAHLWSMMRCSR